PYEEVGGRRRRRKLAVAHEEQVRSAARRHVTFLGEHDRLGESGCLGLALGQGRVHIRAGDLAAGGNGVVVDPAPRRDVAGDALVDVDVVAKGNGEDGESVLEV